MGFLLSPLPSCRAPQLPGRGVPRPETPSEATSVQPCSLPVGSVHGPTAPPANFDETPDFIPACCPLPPRFLWGSCHVSPTAPWFFPTASPASFSALLSWLATTCPSAFHFPNFVAIFFSPIVFVLMFFIVILVLFIIFMFIV